MKEKFKGLGSFFRLWFGQSVSQMGSAMTAFAVSIWAFGEKGTVMSVALLLICNYAPAAVVSAFAGVIVDRFGKKAVMLIADSAAAIVSTFILIMYFNNSLQVSYLYFTNALIGVCNAIQGPASQVAISIITPKDQYMRVSGLQSFSGSFIGILSPVCATALLSFGGFGAVLICDLSTFAVGFMTLLLTKIPYIAPEKKSRGGYMKEMAEGVKCIKTSKLLRTLVGYQWLINLIAGMAYFSVLTPMILARTNQNSMILGWVNTCVGLGAMVGATIMTIWKPTMEKRKLMVLMYTLSFASCDFFLGIGRTPIVWCLAAFFGNLPLPYGDGALGTIYRERVPVNIQGRVFATRDAGIKLFVLLGYLAGAFVADNLAQPLCDMNNFIGSFLTFMLGKGSGRAMGIVFVLTAFMGTFGSAIVGKRLKNLS